MPHKIVAGVDGGGVAVGDDEEAPSLQLLCLLPVAILLYFHYLAKFYGICTIQIYSFFRGVVPDCGDDGSTCHGLSAGETVCAGKYRPKDADCASKGGI